MPSYTITDVSKNVRDWDSQLGGPMKEYRVHLKGPDGVEILNVEWSRKAASPAPSVGQQVEATLEDRGPRGMKLKVTPNMGGGQFGPRPEDPKRAARILRQHSQDMAMRALTHAFAFGLVEAPADSAGLFSLIAKTADWFDKDAEKAAE